jgi:hypothetical protein
MADQRNVCIPEWEYQDLKERLDDTLSLVERLEQNRLDRIDRHIEMAKKLDNAIAQAGKMQDLVAQKDAELSQLGKRLDEAYAEILRLEKLVVHPKGALAQALIQGGREELWSMEESRDYYQTRVEDLEGIVLGMMDASDRMREVGREIQVSRGLR